MTDLVKLDEFQDEMKTRILIVDDENIARKGIRRRTENVPDWEIVGECSNGIEAVSFIRKQKPDLVFLDIQMPGLDGFGVIEEVGVDNMPPVIFITAYDKYAIRAFEVHALDYLLKPFNDERFEQVLQRAKFHIHATNSEFVGRSLSSLLFDMQAIRENFEKGTNTAQDYLKRIVVKSAGRIFFVRVEEIDWFEAADNYVKLHVGTETHLIRNTLRRLESHLSPQKFLRIHRSIMVNVERIKELRPLFKGEFSIKMKNGRELISGRAFRHNFRTLLDEDKRSN